MDYNEAIKIKEKNEHLIGTFYKGARIDEIIVYPKDKPFLDSFLKLYLTSFDAEESLIPFSQQKDFHVAVVCDKQKIYTVGWFIPIDLEYIENAKW